MKIIFKNIVFSILLLLILIISYFIIILNYPIKYDNKYISKKAVSYITELQQTNELSPSQIAERYLYYNTDYENNTPGRIKIRVKNLNDNLIVITIYDPQCEDDSINSSLDKIYLEKDGNLWIPIKHEWSYKGRGRLGWTTETTD
jgi:hypothetical protein